ncbi:MAG: four helix bundle protein [Candidatus Falkowbacteria bacterium]
MATGLENLKIYKLAARLEIFIYKVTEKFPVDEKYNSISQLRRSSLSVSNNIAESYGRHSFKSKINYLYIARGEVEETRSGIDRAYKKGFITEKMSNFIVEKYTELLKSINSYIKFLRNQKTKTN